MITFGIVGTGWRTEFFLRIANARPDLFRVVGVVTRDINRAKDWAASFGVNLYSSVDDMLNDKPLFVVTSLPWDVNPEIVHMLADKGIPVLSETPPATTITELEHLFRHVAEGGAKIAVAEQYHLQPAHAARIAFAHSGKLGRVSQAQVSAGHGYHGISLMRRYLGIGFEDTEIRAIKFNSPIVQSPDRSGPPTQEAIANSEQALAWFRFDDRLGVFDFTPVQYFSYIREPRILVRGERGEIINNDASYLIDYRTPVKITFQRHTSGEFGSMDRHYLKGIQAGESWIYHNPVAPAQLSDDEIAIADCLLKMADYADGGEAFYSLAEACQDRYLDIKLWEAVDAGHPVATQPQMWAQ